MTKVSNVCDKVMFAALLFLVAIIPYSLALIELCLLIIILAWIANRFLIWRATPGRRFLGSFSFSSQGLALPLVIIAVLIVGTVPFSHAPFLSLKKFFSRFLQQAFLMYVAVEIINSPKRLYMTLSVLLLTLAFVNVDIFIQFFSGKSFIFHTVMIYNRVTGPMHHPNDLGTLLVTVIPVIMSLIMIGRSWISLLFNPKFSWILQILCVGLLFLLIVSLGLTASRGAWAAFTVTVLGWGIVLKKHRLTGLIFVALVLFFWVFTIHCANVRTDIAGKKLTQTAGQNITNEAQNSANLEEVFVNHSSRELYWQTAVNIIKRYPLFGCGYNAYIQTLMNLRMTPQEYPHNSILHITAELGLFGLLAYLWFFLSVIVRGIEIFGITSKSRDFNIMGCGIFLGIVAWLIHSLFDTPWESLQLSILWWLMVGIMLNLPVIYKNLNTAKVPAGQGGLDAF